MRVFSMCHTILFKINFMCFFYSVDTTNNIAVLSIEYSNINFTGIADFTYYQSCREPKTVRATTAELYRKYNNFK